MEYLIVLLVIWVVVTLIGHLSWLILTAVVQALLPKQNSGTQQRRAKSSLANDVEATKRVVRRLTHEGYLTEKQMADIASALLDSQSRAPKVQAADAKPHPVSKNKPTSDAPRPENGLSEEPTKYSETTLWADPLLRPDDASIEGVDENTGHDKSSAEQDKRTRPDGEPVAAILVSTALQESNADGTNARKEQSLDRHARERDKSEPTLSRSDLIQSFLSSHNIRWGEIVAGILIVVCSIGLVRTLWTPLVSTHRLVPSLIFLVANSAIGGAGLYTLKRWRLRHTSRAVLVIATLLIPLSVLAGIAAVREEVSLLALADPFTLIFVAIASVAYWRLAYSYISALTSRAHRRMVTFGFAVPTSLLPFGKAATERLGDQAGWSLLIASFAVLATSEFLARSRGVRTVGMGRALSRIHLLFVAITVYGCGILGAYFSIRIDNPSTISYLPIGIPLIPAFVGLGTVALGLKQDAKVAKHSLTGMVAAIFLVVPAFVIAVPAASTTGWIWVWAGLLSACLFWGTYRARQHIWASIAAIPIGFAAVQSIHNLGWVENINGSLLWMRFISGETFVVILAVSFFSALWLLVNRDSGREIWIKQSLLGWLAVGFAISGALVVLPLDYLGAFPLWGLNLSLFLTLSVLIVGAHSTRFGDSKIVIAATVGSMLFWLSLLKPVTWFSELAIEPFAISMFLSGLTLLAAEKIGCVLSNTRHSKWVKLDLRHTEIRLSIIDGSTAGMVVCSLLLVANGGSISRVSVLLLLASFLMLLVAIHSLSPLRRKLAQGISLLLAASLTIHWVPGRYFEAEYWQSGVVFWVLALPCLSLTGTWLIVQKCIAWIAKSSHEKMKSFFLGSPVYLSQKRVIGHEKWELAKIQLDDWKSSIEVCSMVVGLLLGFAGVLTGFGRSLVTLEIAGGYTNSLAFTLACFVGYLALGYLLKRYVARTEWGSYYLNASVMLLVIWLSCAITSSFLFPHQGRVFLMTVSSTFIVLATVAHRYLLDQSNRGTADRSRYYLESVSLVILLLVSTRLFFADWIGQVSRGEEPSAVTMLGVAFWSVLGSLWFRYGGSTFSTSWRQGISVLLFCNAAVLTLPFILRPQLLFFIQSAGLAALIWGMSYLRQRLDDDDWITNHVLLSALTVGVLIGVITSILTTIRVFVFVPYFEVWSGGFCVSFASSAILVSHFGAQVLGGKRKSLGILAATAPICVSLLAGQFAWLIYSLVGLNEAEVRICVGLIWMATSVAALYRERIYEDLLGRLHVVCVSVVMPVITLVLYPQESYFGILGLICISFSGGLVRVLSGRRLILMTGRLNHCIGWWVLVMGSILLNHLCEAGVIGGGFSEIFVVWSIVWLLVWCYRVAPGEQSDLIVDRSYRFPNVALLAFLCLLSGYELWTHLFEASRGQVALGAGWSPLILTKWIGLASLPFWAIFFPSQRTNWFLAFCQSSIVVAFLAVSVSARWQLSTFDQLMIAISSVALFNAVISHWCDRMAAWVARNRCLAHEAILSATGALLVMIASIAMMCVLGAVLMIVQGNLTMVVHFTIGSVALSGWAIAQCTAIRPQESLRRFAVALGLFAVGMWASLDLNPEAISLLRIAMRWLVVSVFLLPAMIWILPAIFGHRARQSWDVSLRWGVKVVSVFCAFSLVSIIALECLIRTESGVLGITTAQVLFVACVLSILAAGAAVLAICTGPGFRLRQTFPLNDRIRELVAYGCQILAVSVCLHLYLCRPDWLYAELREKWHYVVMAFAFLSVAMTELAKRRNDLVLCKVFQRNALLLPLIPIIGCWIGSLGSMGRLLLDNLSMRYDLLLFVAAVYYAMVSHLWKHVGSRLVSIALGNFAWWFMLTQTPGWAFVQHPQLWIIPPAFCVLFAVNLYRDKMDGSTVAFIRYAAMLTIYLSSTADMLLQQIGLTLWGPIVLVLLSLLGMLAGIILRVRAFLFLGTAFVLLGTISMVWHANESLGSWVWWVFGISTGVILLVGLTFLEKYKVQLRQYSESLSKWDR